MLLSTKQVFGRGNLKPPLHSSNQRRKGQFTYFPWAQTWTLRVRNLLKLKLSQHEKFSFETFYKITSHIAKLNTWIMRFIETTYLRMLESIFALVRMRRAVWVLSSLLRVSDTLLKLCSKEWKISSPTSHYQYTTGQNYGLFSEQQVSSFHLSKDPFENQVSCWNLWIMENILSQPNFYWQKNCTILGTYGTTLILDSSVVLLCWWKEEQHNSCWLIASYMGI